MVLKIYGHKLTTCTQRVLVILYEKGIDFELVVVDFPAGEHKTPEHKKYQPFGQLPYMEDDVFILYESRAITYYIAVKYASEGTQGLVPDPADLKATALYLQAASVENNDFHEHAEQAAYEKFFKPRIGLTTDEERLKRLVEKLSERFEGYDAILSKQKYLAGDQITLADLSHLPYGHKLAGISDIFERYPNVSRWWKDISGRPSSHKLLEFIKD